MVRGETTEPEENRKQVLKRTDRLTHDERNPVALRTHQRRSLQWGRPFRLLETISTRRAPPTSLTPRRRLLVSPRPWPTWSWRRASRARPRRSLIASRNRSPLFHGGPIGAINQAGKMRYQKLARIGKKKFQTKQLEFATHLCGRKTVGNRELLLGQMNVKPKNSGRKRCDSWTVSDTMLSSVRRLCNGGARVIDC